MYFFDGTIKGKQNNIHYSMRNLAKKSPSLSWTFINENEAVFTGGCEYDLKHSLSEGEFDLESILDLFEIQYCELDSYDSKENLNEHIIYKNKKLHYEVFYYQELTIDDIETESDFNQFLSSLTKEKIKMIENKYKKPISTYNDFKDNYYYLDEIIITDSPYIEIEEYEKDNFDELLSFLSEENTLTREQIQLKLYKYHFESEFNKSHLGEYRNSKSVFFYNEYIIFYNSDKNYVVVVDSNDEVEMFNLSFKNWFNVNFNKNLKAHEIILNDKMKFELLLWSENFDLNLFNNIKMN